MAKKYEDFFEHSSIFLTCVKSGNFGQDDLYEIHLEILKIDGKKLELVESERFTAEQYLDLCRAAIEQDGLALEWVKDSIIEVADYHKLCYQAVKQNGIALYFVKRELFENNERDLRVIYSAAVHQNGNALQFIQAPSLDLCLMAVKDHASALHWINPQLFSREDYGKICLIAFHAKQGQQFLNRIFGQYTDEKQIQGFMALRWVDREHLLPERYKEICFEAIQFSSASLPFVDKSLWLDKDFCLEAVKLNRRADQYFRNT